MLKALIVWITTNWKILHEMGIPDHLTCLLWNLYAGQEATVRMGHVQQTGSKSRKEYVKAVYCHPAYLTYIQSTTCKMPGWIKHKLESRVPGEMSITSDSLVAQVVKCLPTIWETWVQLLRREDPLQKEIATYSSTLAWKIPWTKEPGTLQSMGSQRVGHDWTTLLSLFFGGGYKPPFDVTKRRRKEI